MKKLPWLSRVRGSAAAALASSWRAHLSLGFTLSGKKTVLAHRCQDGPLVVQKPLYPEGEAVTGVLEVPPETWLASTLKCWDWTQVPKEPFGQGPGVWEVTLPLGP